MSVSIQLEKPETEEDFEAMCAALYRLMWRDTGCMRMGGSGQPQFGVDILGHDGVRSVGIQCKHYLNKPFTLSTVTADVKKAEDAGLVIEHLLFATTAPSKSSLVKEVHALSLSRREAGKFTVSVDFWGDISGHIRLYPEIGRKFLPNFPGSTLLQIAEDTNAHLALYKESQGSETQALATVMDRLDQIQAALSTGATAPTARGDESDPRVATILDLARDRLQAWRSRDALELLEQLGDPAQLVDQYSRFRWHTNRAAVALMEGEYTAAADMFIDAFRMAPDNEKAHSNRAHAYWLKKSLAAALAACDEGLILFPGNVALWSIKVHARMSAGDNDPFRDVPPDMLETPNLIAARAQFSESRGDFPGAVNLLQRCLVADSESFDAKRAYLGVALSWTAHDPVLAHIGQISAAQREALADAVGRLEPLEKTLDTLQSDHISLEVGSNAAMAVMLLGFKDRATAIATHLLARHPGSELPLRLRLNELADRDDIEAIRALTDDQLPELPASVLGLLAEISANHGDVAWHSRVMEHVEAAPNEHAVLQDLRVLSIHARWTAGDQAGAVTAAQDYLAAQPAHILARVLLGQMLKRLGRTSDALEQAETCRSLLTAESSSFEVLKVAELLYALRQYLEAGELYSRLLHIPNDDEITHRLLICLVESDQRRRAQDILDQLSAEIRALPAFRRVDANLARRMGDWLRMQDILAQELARQPEDSGIAIGYIGALHRLGNKPELIDYLATDPRFKDSPPENEFEISKYLVGIGRTDLAVTRMYRAYRSQSASTQVASFYLSRVLMAEQIPELDSPDCAGPGTVLHLRSAAETRVVAIDIETSPGADGWPELIPPDSDLATKLRGLRLGDKTALAGYFGAREAEVVKLTSLYAWAAEKAHDQVAAAAVPAGPLWSVRIVKEDGNLDLDALLQSALQRKAHVRRLFTSYQESRFPVSALAKALGSDPVTLLREWPFKEAALFVSTGTREEQNVAAAVLGQVENRYVLDLLTIAELARHRSFDAAVKLLGRPLVPGTVREHLQVLLQLAATPHGSAVMGENNGRLQLIETPSSYYTDHEAFLLEILRCIDEQCEVVCTVGPQNITHVHRALGEFLDADTLDALYLSIERGAVLVSEDGTLRLWASAAGVVASISTQPVLLEACSKGLLSKEAYADAVVGKIAAGHDFVSVRADDLLSVAKRNPAMASNAVMMAIDSFRSPTLDILSGLEVSCAFLGHAIRQLRPRVAAEYGKHILKVLQYGRPAIAGAIHRAVAWTAKNALQRLNRKLSHKERKAFSRILNAPEQPRVIRQVPLAVAIQKTFQPRDEQR